MYYFTMRIKGGGKQRKGNSRSFIFISYWFSILRKEEEKKASQAEGLPLFNLHREKRGG